MEKRDYFNMNLRERTEWWNQVSTVVTMRFSTASVANGTCWLP